LEVVMKKFLGMIIVSLLILLALPTSASAEEEDLRMPVYNQCRAITNNVQEMRWCKAWDASLRRRDSIRPSEEGDESVVAIMVLVEYIEQKGRTELDVDQSVIAVSTTVVFMSPYFGGQNPWLLSKMDILGVQRWNLESDKIRNYVLNKTVEGLREVMKSIRYLSVGRSDALSVRGMNEEGILRYLATPAVYRNLSTDTVLYLSRP
jgi:hypothetical protein